MGYLYQAIALRSRYRRRRASWQPHLENTKAFVAATAETCCHRGRVIVLGSGLLLDVPLDELSAAFGEVVLVDVVHLPEVRKRISSYRNVRLIEADVTGVAEPLFENVRQRRKELPGSTPYIPAYDGQTGLVVSLNILSQLSAIPQDYAFRKNVARDPSVIEQWCDRIRQAHYGLLSTLACDVCIVADHAYAFKDKKGDVFECGSTVGTVVPQKPETAWQWEIAPLGEASKDYSKELSVGAWRLIHDSAPHPRGG
jgi:hypothetical protein